MSAELGSASAWHDVECGAYAADLGLWSELAREAGGPVLELGAGTGRVALHLAAAGVEVTALDRSDDLLETLRARASDRGVALETVQADARDFDLERRFALICAPMQLMHLLGGGAGRAAALAACAGHLRSGGRFAAALLAGSQPVGGDLPLPLPDVAERDGWVYSSQPVEVRPLAGGLEVRRLRQLVSPDGSLSEELDATRLDPLDADGLEREARSAGLSAAGRLAVGATDDHVGSVVCVLESAR